jgi:hypothetical protein
MLVFNFSKEIFRNSYWIYKAWIQVINATAFKRREANFLALGPKS